MSARLRRNLRLARTNGLDKRTRRRSTRRRLVRLSPIRSRDSIRRMRFLRRPPLHRRFIPRARPRIRITAETRIVRSALSRRSERRIAHSLLARRRRPIKRSPCQTRSLGRNRPCLLPLGRGLGLLAILLPVRVAECRQHRLLLGTGPSRLGLAR